VLHTPVTSERLGDLYGERPNASRRADDQHLLPRLNLPHVAQSLERGGAGGGNGRRLLEGEVRRLGRNLVRSSGRVLGEGAVAGAEHLIARLEPRHILADRLDATCDILAPNADFGTAEPRGHADQVGKARHDVPVPDEYARRLNAEQHVATADHRLLDVLEFQDICCAVPLLDDRLHRILLSLVMGLVEGSRLIAA
jgi:hypothetical protein